MIKLSEMRKGYTKVTAPATVKAGMIGKAIKKINRVGTPIPREGYLGVLFCNNKGLTIAETIEIIDNILDQHTSDTYVAAIIAHYDTSGNITNYRSTLSISRENGEHRIWIDDLYNNNIYIFSSRYGGWSIYGGALFEDYAVGGQLVDEQTDEHQSYYLNDQLINLISPTPFEETIEYEILENIDGVSEVSNWTPLPIKNVVTETVKELVTPAGSIAESGTAISEGCTTAYFNTSITYDEYVEITSQLEPTGSSVGLCGVYNTHFEINGVSVDLVSKSYDYPNNWCIVYNTNPDLPICDIDVDNKKLIWHEPFINTPYHEVSITHISGYVAPQNDLLKGIISATPYEVVEEDVYKEVVINKEVEEWFPIHESNSSYSHVTTIELKDVDNIHNVAYELINNDPALFAKYGFAIADVTYRTTKVVYDRHHYAYVTDAILTICSIGCPTEDIELLISVEV